MGDSLLLSHLPQQLANGLTLGAVYTACPKPCDISQRRRSARRRTCLHWLW